MVEEKILILNIRSLSGKKPVWKRKNYTIKMIRRVLEKNNKGGKVTIGKKLNEKVWENTGTKVKIKLTKDDKVTRAELVE